MTGSTSERDSVSADSFLNRALHGYDAFQIGCGMSGKNDSVAFDFAGDLAFPPAALFGSEHLLAQLRGPVGR
jgi:hypothetical protein